MRSRAMTWTLRKLAPSSSSLAATKSHSTTTLIPSNSPYKDYSQLQWKTHKNLYTQKAAITIVTFNMLAPIYKRLSSMDLTTGHRKREAQNPEMWKARAAKTLNFFAKEIYGKTEIIALQEVWLEPQYSSLFEADFRKNGYQLKLLQRPGHKEDALGFAVQESSFQILAAEHVYLSVMGDRVALILWLQHRLTKSNLIIANTHLTFPHNFMDRFAQLEQMKCLTTVMETFARRNEILDVSRCIMGDFNVESKSLVCDHLRNVGYVSCFEVCSPLNQGESNQEKEEISHHEEEEEHSNNNTIASFVSHHNHRREDVGVDHIFLKPPSSSPLHDSVFVDNCHVLPKGVTCKLWDAKFQISDHRPVGASIILAQHKNPQL